MEIFGIALKKTENQKQNKASKTFYRPQNLVPSPTPNLSPFNPLSTPPFSLFKKKRKLFFILPLFSLGFFFSFFSTLPFLPPQICSQK